MLTPDDLAGLEPGDEVEMGDLLAGVTDAPLVFAVEEVRPEKPLVRFAVRYLGVRLGTWYARGQKGKKGSEGKVVWVDERDLQRPKGKVPQ